MVTIRGITRLARDSAMRLAVAVAVAPKKIVARLAFKAYEGEFAAKLKVPKRDRGKRLLLALTAVKPAHSELKTFTIKFMLKPT
jgi:hypothetical protein